MTTETTTEETPDARAAWVEKISKLLAKAERAGTEEEAAAFFAKAQELMTKWEIEEAELRDAGTAGPVDWTVICHVMRLSTFSPKQDASAIHHVSKAMGLKAVYSSYVKGVNKPEMWIYGTTEDLARFEMMWTSVYAQMVQAMRRDEPKTDRNAQRTFRLGYKVGYGERIGRRIAEARGKATGKSLVLAGKSEAVERAIERSVGPTKAVKMRVDENGRRAGAAAANSADLGINDRVPGAKAKAIKA